MLKKIFLLYAILLSSFFSIEAREEQVTWPSDIMEFPPSQYFSKELCKYSPYRWTCHRCDLLIDMIKNSTEPLKTTVLKTTLLVELKEAENRLSMGDLSRDSDYCGGRHGDMYYEEFKELREKELLFIKEFQSAERFTK